MKPGAITIVGAGLAGSLLAVFLARRGCQVVVRERLPDPQSGQAPAGRSINLALAQRGIHALQLLGLQQAVDEFAIPMRGRMVHPLHGETELQPYGSRPDEVIYAVHRARLNTTLLDAARAESGVELCFNSTLVDGDLTQDRLLFRDELTGVVETVHSGPVIGADGAGSALRELVDRAHGTASQSDLLDHGYKELTIPPAGREFRLDPNALHIWPRGGYMLIALPNHDKSFTATLFLANEGEPAFGTLKDPSSVKALFAREFPDTEKLIPGLEEEFFERPTGVLGTVRCPHWCYQDKALLVGDAAHAIVPFHGQGMNCAFEDCSVLDQLLRLHGGKWEETFTAFEAERRKNTEAIAAMALENYIEMRDSVRDAGYKLKKELGRLLEQRFSEHFIPRYSMVMFHRIPYSEVYARGEVQAGILDELTKGVKSVNQVDWALARSLIGQRLTEIPNS